MINRGLPVKGYQPQSDRAVGMVNLHKELEERVLRQIDILPELVSVDLRWLAIAKTQLEQGFMSLNRAVFQPGRVSLPGDEENSAIEGDEIT